MEPSSDIKTVKMDSEESTDEKFDPNSKLTDEKIECSRMKVTPFSIADILTRGSSGDETQAIDMSRKCSSYEPQGTYSFHSFLLGSLCAYIPLKKRRMYNGLKYIKFWSFNSRLRKTKIC